MSEKKPVAHVIPSWDKNKPRYIVVDCNECGDDRQFKDGRAVYNQRLDMCYNSEEIVDALNNLDSEIVKLKKYSQARLNEISGFKKGVHDVIEGELDKYAKMLIGKTEDTSSITDIIEVINDIKDGVSKYF